MQSSYMYKIKGTGKKWTKPADYDEQQSKC